VIRRLRGKLVHNSVGRIELQTAGGVGYELLVPATLFERLPPTGHEVEIHSALVVRDDALELYGFEDGADRELFLRLQSASGVGPRLALALLSALPAGRLVRAIRSRDHAVLQTVSGVGRKMAERIAVELADKMDDIDTAEREPEEIPAGVAAVEALRSLGYGQIESEDAVARARQDMQDPEPDMEELLRVALRHV
jgi:Holliday junction DNA helicase RuvA